MLKVVFDTNIYLSAILFGGLPQRLVKEALEKKFALYISQEIISEVLGVLSKKFRYPAEKLRQTEILLKDLSTLVYPQEVIKVIKKWPADNRILECAVKAKADCLVSGDKKHLLPLKQFRQITIVSAREFLKLL